MQRKQDQEIFFSNDSVSQELILMNEDDIENSMIERYGKSPMISDDSSNNWYSQFFESVTSSVREENVQKYQIKETNLIQDKHILEFKFKLDSIVQENIGIKHRQGSTKQSKVQKILKKITDGHVCKNLPSEILRKIKKFLKERKMKNLIDVSKKRLSIQQLIQFIKSSGLSVDDWCMIFDIKEIDKIIEKSKKLGTSYHYKCLSFQKKQFLIHANKEMQKLVYRSVKRVVLNLVVSGILFFSYLDEQANQKFNELDLFYQNSSKYSTQYQSLLLQLNLVSN